MKYVFKIGAKSKGYVYKVNLKQLYLPKAVFPPLYPEPNLSLSLNSLLKIFFYLREWGSAKFYSSFIHDLVVKQLFPY